MQNKNIIAGIDFGTTTSAISILENGLPKILKVENHSPLLPSIVAFSRNGKILIGDDAKKQALLNPERTFRSIKRKLGEDASVMIDATPWTFEQMGAEIIKKLVSSAEKITKKEISKAVITVPAYFNDIQRKALKNMGGKANLEVLRIINEPTAAAMAYGINTEIDHTVLVFDFGGGTFDISILSIADGVFEVLATGGDNKFGGDDIDNILISNIVSEFRKARGVDIGRDKLALQKLRDEAEKLKIKLSVTPTATIKIPFITADKHGPIHLERTFTVEEFNKLISGIINKLISITMDTLRMTDLENDEIDKVLLVGGSTKIPAIKEALLKKMGEKIVGGVNPVECVSLGASIQGGILAGDLQNRVLLDVIPLTLGVEIEGGSTEPIIEKNSTIPVSKKKTFSTVVDDQTEVEVRIVQGNSDRADENVEIGRFTLDKIASGKKGIPKIDVEFDIDANGIMKVSAKDNATGSFKSLKIEQSHKNKTSGVI